MRSTAGGTGFRKEQGEGKSVPMAWVRTITVTSVLKLVCLSGCLYCPGLSADVYPDRLGAADWSKFVLKKRAKVWKERRNMSPQSLVNQGQRCSANTPGEEPGGRRRGPSCPSYP